MRNLIFVVLLITFIAAGCHKEKDYLVTIKTRFGDIGLILYDQTPEHKQNFLKLAQSGQYDSTLFHRVIPAFMIQGGDVGTRPGSSGDVDYTLPAEFVDTLFHHYGALAAARQGDGVNPEKRSSGSQFYIVQGTIADADQLTTDMQQLNKLLPNLAEVPGYETILDTLRNLYFNAGEAAYNAKLMQLVPVIEERFDVQLKKKYPKDRLQAYTRIGGTWHLDDAYTVFGRVVSGMQVVEQIAAVQTAPGDKPVEPVYMTVEVEEISQKQIREFPDIYSVK
jgi:peptidyl-prolyl cis-trans isomerase B (cyclophilin B)